MKKRFTLKLTAAWALTKSAGASMAQDAIKIANIVKLLGGGARASTNFKNGVALAVSVQALRQPRSKRINFLCPGWQGKPTLYPISAP